MWEGSCKGGESVWEGRVCVCVCVFVNFVNGIWVLDDICLNEYVKI